MPRQRQEPLAVDIADVIGDFFDAGDLEVLSHLDRSSPDNMPAYPRVPETSTANKSGSVHFPDRHLAGIVLPENAGAAIAVEISGRDDVSARARIAEAPAL